MTGLLRDTLGFAGLAVTDALTMDGVARGYGAAESAVRSLQAGDDVLLHGFRVGQVEGIRYEPRGDPATPIVVRCTLPADVVRRLGRGTQFTIHSAGPLGGRFVEVSPSPRTLEPEEGAPPPAEVAEGPPGPYVGEAPGDLFRQLEGLVETNQQSITEAVEAIRAILDDIRVGRGLMGQLIQDPVLAAEFQATVSEVREMFRAINAAEGPLGALIRDADMRDRLALAIADLSDVIAGLKRGEGTVGLLLRDQETQDRVQRTIARIDEIAEEVRSGSGTIARLLHDAELADDLRGTVAKANEVADKVNRGSGTIGQLINNPRAWEEVLKLLILAREAVEDLREQAPISTFVNALFATF
jgi:phospholipid/cholesterol/gamma-HCH transport system substrate-binding protein